MKQVSLLVGALLLLGVSQLEAANRYVCAAGANCDSGSPHGAGTSYATINLAIDAAASGDTIFIRAGETFTENVVLDNKGTLASRIVLRSDAADSCFPAANLRLIPTVRADGVPVVGNTDPDCLPTIKATGGGNKAVTTAAGARDYTLQFLRFTENVQGGNGIIELGALTGQEKVADEPRNITVDRVLVEANHLIGQKIGVLVNGANLAVTNSYFTNIAGYFQDAVCIGGNNGSGPILIENNYGECGAYHVIFGGADQQEYTTASTAASSTTTTINLNAATFRADHDISTLSVGQHVAIQVDASTAVQRQWSYVASIVDADTFTISPAIASAPASGLDVRWGIVYDDIDIKRNYFYKPLRWQSPIMASPQGVQATPSNAAGTLAAGDYYYVVTTQRTGSYGNNTLHSAPSAQVHCHLDATGQCVLTWTENTEATGYRIDGRASGSSTMFWTVSGSDTVTFTDTGSAGTTGTRADDTGSITTANPRIGYWTTKNHIEIKQGTNVLIEGNILENAWTNQFGGTGSGTSIWEKSVNQSGATEFSQTKGIITRYNVMKNVGGCFLFTSQEEYTTGIEGRPNHLENVEVYDNLCILSGGANAAVNQPAVTNGYSGAKNFSFCGNTLAHTKHSTWQFQSTPQPWPGTRLICNNIFWHNSYGFMSDVPAGNFGAASVTAHIGDANFLNNILTSSSYIGFPPSTLRPTQAALEAEFVNFGGSEIGDYALRAASPYRTGSTTGGIIGADIAQVILQTNGVIDGIQAGAPTITTTSLPEATVGNVYSVQLTSGTGTGTGAKTWTATGLPAGFTLSTAGVLSAGVSGTSAGTTSIVVRVTDSLALFTERTLSLVVNPAAVPVTIVTTSLPNCVVNATYAQTLLASGGSAAYQWSVSAGALPPGWTLNASSGVLAGACSVTGPYTFTVLVSSGAQSDTQPYALSITQTTNPPGRPGPRNTLVNGVQIHITADTDAPVVDPENPRSSPQPKDFWIDDNRVPWVFDDPGASPPTLRGIGAHLVIPISSSPAGVNVTNPVADTGTEFGTNMRQFVDLSRGYTQCRLHTYVADAGIAGGTTRAQYSLDNSTFVALDGTTGPNASNASTGYQTSGWVTLATEARADVWLRVIAIGDGTNTVGFRLVSIECR